MIFICLLLRRHGFVAITMINTIFVLMVIDFITCQGYILRVVELELFEKIISSLKLNLVNIMALLNTSN